MQNRKAQDRLETFGCALLVLLVLVGIGGLVSLFSGSDDSKSNEKTAVVAAPPSLAQQQHATRAAARAYWNPVIGDLATAASAMGYASKALDAGDPISAQRYIIGAERYTSDAWSAAAQTTPYSDDDWTTIQDDLMNAASSYRSSIRNLSDAIDSGDTRQIAQAEDDISNARGDVDDATSVYRSWYSSHGGRSSDVADLDREIKAVDRLSGLLVGTGQ